MGKQPSYRNYRSIAAAAIAATILKLVLAFFTIGTNDSVTWDNDLTRFRTVGFAQLYRKGVQWPRPSGRMGPNQAFIHPPGILHLMQLLEWLRDTFGLPLHFWLRAACAFADIGTLLVVCRMFAPYVNPSSSRSGPELT